MGFPVKKEVTSHEQLKTNSRWCLAQTEFTRIVVMMSVLLASVSDALRSRDVEFMTRVLLEYQVPICWSRRKMTGQKRKSK